jgi:hypothetical protein
VSCDFHCKQVFPRLDARKFLGICSARCLVLEIGMPKKLHLLFQKGRGVVLALRQA